MRRVVAPTLLIVFLVVALIAADEKPWFDMENCGYCCVLMKNPELLPNTDWEHHKISNGVMSVTTVKEAYKKDWDEAMAAMIAIGKKAEAGEPVNMCGMCEAMGNLIVKGARMESVDTRHGNVLLLISNDPAVVADIHAWADKTNAEHAKIEAAQKEKSE